MAARDRMETRIDPAVKQAAAEVAQARDRSLSNFVEVALKRAIDLDDGIRGGRAAKRPWRRKESLHPLLRKLLHVEQKVWDGLLHSAQHNLNEAERLLRAERPGMNTTLAEIAGHVTEASVLVIEAAQELQRQGELVAEQLAMQ